MTTTATTELELDPAEIPAEIDDADAVTEAERRWWADQNEDWHDDGGPDDMEDRAGVFGWFVAMESHQPRPGRLTAEDVMVATGCC